MCGGNVGVSHRPVVKVDCSKAVSTLSAVLYVSSLNGPADASQEGREASSVLEGSRGGGSRLGNTGSGAPCAPAQGELPILLLAGSNLELPAGVGVLVSSCSDGTLEGVMPAHTAATERRVPFLRGTGGGYCSNRAATEPGCSLAARDTTAQSTNDGVRAEKRPRTESSFSNGSQARTRRPSAVGGVGTLSPTRLGDSDKGGGSAMVVTSGGDAETVATASVNLREVADDNASFHNGEPDRDVIQPTMMSRSRAREIATFTRAGSVRKPRRRPTLVQVTMTMSASCPCIESTDATLTGNEAAATMSLRRDS